MSELYDSPAGVHKTRGNDVGNADGVAIDRHTYPPLNPGYTVLYMRDGVEGTLCMADGGRPRLPSDTERLQEFAA